MAGKTMPEIYCWAIKLDELDIYLASSRRGAVRIGLGVKRGYGCLDYFKKIFPLARVIKDEHINLNLLEAVKAALWNRLSQINLPLDILATPFQLMVWEAIAAIPFGETRTYGEVARMIGRPGAGRAVGQAMKRNPLPLIFP